MNLDIIPGKKEEIAKLLLRLPVTLNKKIEFLKKETSRSKNEIVVKILEKALESVDPEQTSDNGQEVA